MDILVEAHDERELERALSSGATLVGVNSRDLRTFEVSLETCLRLGPKIPRDVVAVAESGIRSATDVQRLRDAGFVGFLVGEHFMRAPSPGTALAALLAHARVGGRA
jgi:indole-3-glycerol phosphate synthase